MFSNVKNQPELTVDERIEFLKKLKEWILANEKDICDALWNDIHKSADESFLTEIYMVINEINYFIKNLKRLTKPKRKFSLLMQGRYYVYYEPYGTVLIISPWNYPFHLSIMPLVGAIASGNKTIIKPSEFSVHTSALIKKLTQEVFEERYATTVLGEVQETQYLLSLPFDYIFFTGSPAVGKIVMEHASKQLTPVTLELGGKSPTVVYKTKDISLVAKRIAYGKFINCGQTCIAPDYLIIERVYLDEFLSEFRRWVANFFGENPKDSRFYGRIINEKHIQRLSKLLSEFKDGIVLGGEVDENNKYISPTIVLNPPFDSGIMNEEIFGPILPVITVDTLDEAKYIISKNPYPLAMYIFTDDEQVKNELLKIKAGGVSINDTISHIVIDDLPFGGIKTSGIGKYHGRYSFETFSNKKAVFEKNKIEVPMKYPPYKFLDSFKRFLVK
ncbi:hypothetical protein IB67_08655 [Fervidobacterium riparium]|nr:hypothetical protein IB67_08655 [Fervidobacterium riparium]